MAFVTLVALFLFGFVFAGLGGSSPTQSSTTTISPPKIERHGPKCSARMGAEDRLKKCGGPPANP